MTGASKVPKAQRKSPTHSTHPTAHYGVLGTCESALTYYEAAAHAVMDELESSMEVHEVDLAERKGAVTSYSLSTGTSSGGSLTIATSASNSCKGLTSVSDECCEIVQDILDGDTSSETCQDLSDTCPSIGFPSHNRKVWDAQMACIGWDNDSSDGEILGTP